MALAEDITRWEKQVRKQQNGCWIWTGTWRDKGGAFHWTEDGKRQSASIMKYGYIQMKGPVAKGHVVVRGCDSHHCVNPDHMKVGPQSEVRKLEGKTTKEMGRGKEDLFVPEPYPENECAHFWVVEPPAGESSEGVCKFCHERYQFPNYKAEQGGWR
jgi:hypothetical protein